MSSLSLKEFQDQVSELLLRHRSVLDVLSKFTQSNAGVQRSVAKAITECGCIQVHAGRQQYTSEMTINDAKRLLETHVAGDLCESCVDIVASEVGKNLFYMASLCNLLGVDLQKVVEDESKRCSTLGFFNMS